MRPGGVPCHTVNGGALFLILGDMIRWFYLINLHMQAVRRSKWFGLYSSFSIFSSCIWVLLELIVAGQPTNTFFLVTHSIVLKSPPSLRVPRFLTCAQDHPFDPSPSSHLPTTNEMGANLSSNYKPTTFPKANDALDVIGAADAINEKILLILWIGSVYGIAMIASTVMLVDHWRGPKGERSIGFASVVAGVILSTAWPLVFVYLMTSS
jgi:hypothetical protein